MVDRHSLTFAWDEYGATFGVICPYTPSDPDRPCWPHDTEANDNPSLDAPQDLCTYKSWIDNLTADEVNTTQFTVVLPIVKVDWSDGDGIPEFKTSAPYAYHQPTNQLPEGQD